MASNDVSVAEEATDALDLRSWLWPKELDVRNIPPNGVGCPSDLGRRASALGLASGASCRARRRHSAPEAPPPPRRVTLHRPELDGTQGGSSGSGAPAVSGPSRCRLYVPTKTDEWLVPKDLAARRVRFSACGALAHQDGREEASRRRQSTPAPGENGDRGGNGQRSSVTMLSGGDGRKQRWSVTDANAGAATAARVADLVQVQTSEPSVLPQSASPTPVAPPAAAPRAPIAHAAPRAPAPRPPPPSAPPVHHVRVVKVLEVEYMDVRPHQPRMSTMRSSGGLGINGSHRLSNGPLSQLAEEGEFMRVGRRGSHAHSHRASASHLVPRHHGSYGSHSVALAHPHTMHVYMLVEQAAPLPPPPPPPVPMLQITNGPVPIDSISGPPTDVSGSAAFQQLAPMPSDQLQISHQASSVQPDGLTGAQAASPAVTGAEGSFGVYLQQGTLFGGVASLSSEVCMLVMAMRRGEPVSLASHGPQLVSNVARGSFLGAAGAGLACLCGPVAPTAIFVGYGVGNEWSKINMSLQRREIKSREATGRATQVLFGAAGGVGAAWGTATFLVGVGGVATAAAAGACALAGSAAGQRLGTLLMGCLPETTDERRLAAAYVELGLEPNCSDKELRQAFIRAAKSFHPDRLGPRMPGSHERFANLSAAMDCIRAERCRSGLKASRRLSRLLPLDDAGKVKLTPRGSGAPPSALGRRISFTENCF